jgi:hypothetical protein
MAFAAEGRPDDDTRAIPALHWSATTCMALGMGSKGYSSCQTWQKMSVVRRTESSRLSAADQKVVQWVHKQLMRGYISRPTRALHAAEVKQTMPEVLDKRDNLHPNAAPLIVDNHHTLPVHTTRQHHKRVIKQIAQGAAPGHNGWTFAPSS